MHSEKYDLPKSIESDLVILAEKFKVSKCQIKVAVIADDVVGLIYE